MKKINHRKLLENWDTVIMQLCDEICTHDVLNVVDQYLDGIRKEAARNKMPTFKLDQCREHLRKAINAIDPEWKD